MPKGLFRVHDWRNDVVTIGHVPAEFVAEATEGIYRKPWPAQLNRLVWEGGHDLILSIGQVVPHEVIGMANYNKNLFVGTGGQAGINESHFIGAAYGMERMMGRADTPLRRILNYAQDHFCRHLPLVFVLTVIGPRDDGSLAVRGLFIGDDVECFERAAALSVQVNFTILDEPPQKVVVYLDPEEFHSTWLGNKAIYRTRMAIADAGELVVLAPGVATFGEDPEIDRMIRKYGYRTTPEIMRFVEQTDDLPKNLSAAAHLIHGSSEERFTITYCPGKLSREEIESVGYRYAELQRDAPALRSENAPRRLERAARRRADLLRQQPGVGALGVSGAAGVILSEAKGSADATDDRAHDPVIFFAPLPQCLVEQHGRRDGDVQAVGHAEHRQADGRMSSPVQTDDSPAASLPSTMAVGPR